MSAAARSPKGRWRRTGVAGAAAVKLGAAGVRDLGRRLAGGHDDGFLDEESGRILFEAFSQLPLLPFARCNAVNLMASMSITRRKSRRLIPSMMAPSV